jgi:hypothetical protein
VTALSQQQPYPGLRPYDKGDEAFFFGRAAQTVALRKKMQTSRLVAVVGRSGCGKSSLVRAGLVPALAREEAEGVTVWRIVSFRPQGQPIAELSAELFRLASEADASAPQPVRELELVGGGTDLRSEAPSVPPIAPADLRQLRRSRLDAMLRRSSKGLIEAAAELRLPATARLLIIVDQFEEIFRFEGASGSDANEATAFVRLLIEAVSAENPPIDVILTMRLDFLGDCARFARLPEAISDGQFLVPNLSRAERRAAIEEPAKKCDKSVRPEVTQRLLNEIGEDPDQLPVLQHVLMRMWQHAGDRPAITLTDYVDTGGVTAAISRHADQIYAALPSEAHRNAAERLFKAISERDRRGRSIRRATRFGDIADIVAADATASTPAPNLLQEVVDAFRASDCCFLMPPTDELLASNTLIDISHESLLRGWDKLTGQSGVDGWIAEEERDGRIYASLVEAAESDSTLSAPVAVQRQQWWARARPNAAWARRYGDHFKEVETFVRKSGHSVTVRRFTIGGLIGLITLSTLAALLFASYYQGEKGQTELLASQKRALEQQFRELDARHNELTVQYRDKLVELDQARLDLKRQVDLLEEEKSKFRANLRQAQSAVPASDQRVQQDLTKLLSASAANSDDRLAQRPAIDPKAGNLPATLTSTTGFMWIGSDQAGNLTTPAGAPVLPSALETDRPYLTNLDIYLRQGLPDTTTYAQQPTAGILPQGTLVQVLSIAPPYPRPTGQQYWAQVRVVKLALPTIYFQFAGGSRDQAKQISAALKDKGYKIPGEERIDSAAGQHEVRYFYAGQKPIAQQLANDLNQVLQQQGYPKTAVVIDSGGPVTKSNPDGKLEVWLEIPPK